MYKLGPIVAVFLGLSASQAITLQAEDAVLSGTTVGTAVAGYIGKPQNLSL
jgi:hypothetical protein